MSLPAFPCPGCAKVVDDGWDPGNPGRIPLPGDYTFCSYCGAFLKFGAHMQLLLVPDEEIAALDDGQKAYFARIKASVVLAIVDRKFRDLEERSMN